MVACCSGSLGDRSVLCIAVLIMSAYHCPNTALLCAANFRNCKPNDNNYFTSNIAVLCSGVFTDRGKAHFHIIYLTNSVSNGWSFNITFSRWQRLLKNEAINWWNRTVEHHTNYSGMVFRVGSLFGQLYNHTYVTGLLRLIKVTKKFQTDFCCYIKNCPILCDKQT